MEIELPPNFNPNDPFGAKSQMKPSLPENANYQHMVFEFTTVTTTIDTVKGVLNEMVEAGWEVWSVSPPTDDHVFVIAKKAVGVCSLRLPINYIGYEQV